MLYTFGDHYTLDPVCYELRQHGRLVRLEPQVFDLLAYLVQSPDRTVTKEELMEHLWPQQFVADDSLTYCVAQARKALGDTGQTQRYIQTVRRRGYRFIAPVAVRPAAPVGGDATALAPPSPRATRPQAVYDLGPGLSPQWTAGAADGVPETAGQVEEASLQHRTPAMAGGWKLVTVLCCAVSEPSTGTPLTVEPPYRALRAFYPLARQVVQRYGGTLQPVVGEQILAIFGAPLAQEEHAQRAVLAALELQRRVREAGSAPSAQPGPRWEVRLGLHTGHVAVDLFEETPESTGAVVGDTVTRAGALQAQAAPGTIRCSRATARLVHEVVHVAAVEPDPMAGQSPLATAYLVLGQRAPWRLQGLREARVLTPFIGRALELATLHALVASVEAGRGQVVGIIGEPGIGKTRLCYEFIRGQLASPWCILETRPVSYDRAIPYVPIIALLKNYFQLDERDLAPAIRDQVTTRLLTLDPALAPMVPAILALLDVPVEDPQWQTLDPPQRRQQTFQAIKCLLLRASQVQPLLVVMENLHWVDTETQACLDILVESLPTARLLLLVTYRPEHQHGWGSKTSYTQVRLDALPPEHMDTFLQALLGDDLGLTPLKHLLIMRTAGNPFFLEESVLTLVESGALVGEPGAYRLAQSVPTIQVPATVQAVLAARIDRLSPEDKRLLQTAAVIGMEVPVSLLQAIADVPTETLYRGLMHLQAAEFLYETCLFPEPEYTFKHALTHEVAYGSLLQERRRVLHAQIVTALEALAGDQVAEQVERLAHHAVRGAVWDKSVTYCQQAGARARDRAAFREAVAPYEQALQALAHLPEDGDTRGLALALRFTLGDLLATNLGELGRGHALMGEAEALARALDDRAWLVRVLAKIGQGRRVLGDFDGALAAGQQALELAVELGDSALQVEASYFLGQTYYVSGDFRRAAKLQRWTVEATDREAGTPRTDVRSQARARLATILGALGAFVEGRRHGEEALRLATLDGREDRPLIAHGSVGELYLAQGDLEPAIRVLEPGLALSRASGNRSWVVLTAGPLGYAYALQGRLAEGRALLEEAIRESLRMGALGWQSRWVAWLSEVCRLAGRGAEAWQYARQALDLARQQKTRGNEALALHQLGVVYAHADPPDAAQAEAHYRQALVLAEELGMRPLVAHCHRGLGTLYAKAGQHEQARAELSTAIDLYRAMDMTFWLPQAETTLAQIEGQ